jgi:histidinol-phosphatase (PHP family)
MHASGTIEDYVQRAIEKGYSTLGFSDHAPFEDGFFGNARMSIDQLPYYVSAIKDMRQKYGDKIRIPIGLELEYLPKYHRAHVNIYKEAGIEYLILGQHYLSAGNDIGNAICSFTETDDKGEYTFYVDQCIEALGTGDFCYFAHPDVFKFTGCRDFYLSESERLIRAAMKYSIPLEVNMYGLLESRHYPRDDFWRLAGKLGATVVLGRDAHKTVRVHDDSEFPKAIAFLKKHGLDKLRVEELNI